MSAACFLFFLWSAAVSAAFFLFCFACPKKRKAKGQSGGDRRTPKKRKQAAETTGLLKKTASPKSRAAPLLKARGQFGGRPSYPIQRQRRHVPYWPPGFPKEMCRLLWNDRCDSERLSDGKFHSLWIETLLFTPSGETRMRYAVLILALLGVAATGAIGFKWYSDSKTESEKGRELVKKLGGSPVEQEAKLKKLDELASKINLICYGMFGVAVLGLAGGILGFLRKKFIAAPLLLIPPAIPCYFGLAVEGFLVRVLILCSPLLLAGLLSFLIKVQPSAAKPGRSGKGRAVDEDEDVEEPAHAADEDAESAYAALEMEGDETEAEAAPPKRGMKKPVEGGIPVRRGGRTRRGGGGHDGGGRAHRSGSARSRRTTRRSGSRRSRSRRAAPHAALFEEPESPALPFEEEIPARPRTINKFVCPSCDTYLKSSAPLPVGKPFHCPKCRDAVAVTARH